jgi:uncharacterized DUF497 family protein
MDSQFQWDPTKAASNLGKHGVDFLEAATVFGDPFAIEYDDPDHSLDEERKIILGYSNLGKLLVICFTHRTGQIIRIFSARPATKQERTRYEEES